MKCCVLCSLKCCVFSFVVVCCCLQLKATVLASVKCFKSFLTSVNPSKTEDGQMLTTNIRKCDGRKDSAGYSPGGSPAELQLNSLRSTGGPALIYLHFKGMGGRAVIINKLPRVQLCYL